MSIQIIVFLLFIYLSILFIHSIIFAIWVSGSGSGSDSGSGSGFMINSVVLGGC